MFLDTFRIRYIIVENCNMMLLCHALNLRHLATAQCAKDEERKQRRLSGEEIREILEKAFQDYGEPLDTVTHGW